MRRHPRRFKIFVTGQKARLARGTSLGEVYARTVGYWHNRKYVDVAFVTARNARGVTMMPLHAVRHRPPLMDQMVKILVCQC